MKSLCLLLVALMVPLCAMDGPLVPDQLAVDGPLTPEQVQVTTTPVPYVQQLQPCCPCYVPARAADDGVVGAMIVATLGMAAIAGIVAWVHSGGNKHHHHHSH
jgi:hypothetical protein